MTALQRRTKVTMCDAACVCVAVFSMHFSRDSQMLVLNYALLVLDSILNSNKAMNLKAKSDLIDLTEFAFPYK